MSDIGVLVSLDDQSVEQSKVILDYTSRDFTAIRSQLIGLAQGLMPDWKTVGEASDFGTLLLELFAYMGDVMNFYIDRTASEAFLGTAVRRQSVLYIADMLGYTPIGQQAASVKLFFSLDAEAEKAVTIPKGSRVHNASNDAESLMVFETNQAVTLQPGDLDKQVFATEGVQVRGDLLGLSRGVPNSEFLLSNKGVVYNSVTVVSQEAYQVVDWSYVSDLANARPTQNVFTTFIDEDTYTHVIFGDNSSGRIPPVGAQLSVSYRFGKGAAANSIAVGDLNTMVAIPGLEEQWAVSVKNLESPVGGTDPESIESMRYSIPRSASRLKRRAITLNDFADLAMQVPGVAKSVSYGAVYTAVKVRIAPQEGKADDELMDRLCLEVETYMADKVIVGSNVYAEPHDIDELWLDVYIRVMVHVVASFNRTAVQSQVETVIRQLLSFNNVDFGFRVSIGSIYRGVLAVQGVEWAELQWLSTEPPPSELVFKPMSQVAPRGPSVEPLSSTVTELLLEAQWHYDTGTGTGNPGAGNFRVTTQGNRPRVILSTTDAAAVDQSAVLNTLQIGDHAVVMEIGNHDLWSSLVVIADPAFNSGWLEAEMARVEVSPDGVPTPGNDVEITFIRYAPTPTSPTGDVVNIETPELLIPRIEPTEVTEEETDFPTMNEEERTHDGLWIKAVGGLPST